MYGVHGYDLGLDTDTEEVEDCVSDLRTALAAHGITLPSVGIEPAALANRPSLPLVALGNCNVETARRLAAVLRTAWRGEPEQ